MRTTRIGIALLLATSIAFAPAASATGWLVNFEDQMITFLSLKIGANPAGGQGDFLDVGLGNTQCTDEDDVVDVGVLNREGSADCYYTGEGCHAEEGENQLGIRDPIGGGKDATHPHEPRCSDDGDTVDVGIANSEGSYNEWTGCEPRDPYCAEYTYGDKEDAADVGLLNRETQDDDDAVDAGVLNCEWSDYDDGVDGGVLNNEWMYDGGDTFDLALINWEDADGPDRNGVNVLTNNFAWQFCYFDVVGPRAVVLG